jgi:predicted permease
MLGTMLKPLLRGLLRTPGSSAAAVIAIALGVGASTAVFSVVDRILYRPLPYAQESRLVWLGMGTPLDPQEFLLGPDYLDWRDQQQVFTHLTSANGVGDCDLLEHNPARLHCGRVEANFLETLGVAPALGRDFTRADDRPGAEPAALISYGLWRSRFGGDPTVLNRTMNIDGRPARIAGILPANFEYPSLAPVDILLPQQLDEPLQRKRDRMALLTVIGRLKPGLNAAQARAALQPLYDKALLEVPAAFRKEIRFLLNPLRDRQTRDTSQAARLLLAAVICVLLICCANVANLLLARAAGRRQEVAVRQALGASRGRLMVESLSGSLVLCGTGGVVGVLLAALLLSVARGLAPEGIVRLQQAQIDGRMLGFAVLLTLVTGLLAGLAPALLRVSSEDLSGTRATSRSLGWLKPLLVTAQFAVSVMLLTGAGLLLESLWKMQNVELGFRHEQVLTAAVRVDSNHANMLAERLRRLPGVSQVAVSDSVPPTGRTAASIYSRFEVEGRAAGAKSGTGGMVTWRTVTPEYFPALRIPILRGRAFQPAEAGTVVISQALAQRLFPAEEAVGRRMRPGPESPWLTVTGVAANVKNNRLDPKDDPEYYLPRPAAPNPTQRRIYAIVRSTLPAAALAPMVREEVRQMDAALPVEIETLGQRVDTLYARPRFQTVVLGLFAVLGVLLAAIGLYGVIGYFAQQRTREIGVRLCLGSTPGGIVGLILASALRWTCSGAVLGLAGAWFGSRLVKSLLFQTSEHHAGVYLGVTALLLGVGLLAAWLPSARASRLDPMRALRDQ